MLIRSFKVLLLMISLKKPRRMWECVCVCDCNSAHVSFEKLNECIIEQENFMHCNFLRKAFYFFVYFVPAYCTKQDVRKIILLTSFSKDLWIILVFYRNSKGCYDSQHVCVCVCVFQSYLTLCNPMDHSPPVTEKYNNFEQNVKLPG